MKNKFFAYCRKSSEDSHKQVASIDDQTSAVQKIVDTEKLNLLHIFKEEKSSKEPGRPVFNEMLDRIQKGEANGIVCWAINRLYRNPVDEGRLRWMLQKGLIKVIKTPSREFYPDDAGLLMGVEGGQATDYVIRLSKDVKRGLNSKVLAGWRPSPAPVGYKNVGEVGSKIVVPDPERFDLVRKMWDLFLTGNYPVSKVRDIANNQWGLRTIQRKRLGNRPLAMSHAYKIFNSPFYYGEFLWKDPETGEHRLFKGNHEPMITEDEYWRAQAILGKKGTQRPQTKTFAFTGLMRCGECGCGITAEEKVKKQKNGNVHHYVYYRCTKKRGACSQQYIEQQELEKQFKNELQKITIDQDYLDVALDYLQQKQKDSGKEEKTIRKSMEEAHDDVQKRLNRLHNEYTSSHNVNHELYTPDEFKGLKQALVKERDDLQKQLEQARNKLDKRNEECERIFNFCHLALKEFSTGDLMKKRNIFSTIGSDLILKDKKLCIQKVHPLLLIENELSKQKKLKSRLEPVKSVDTKGKETTFVASIPNWLPG